MDDIGEKLKKLLKEDSAFSSLRNEMVDKEGPEQQIARMMMAVKCLSARSIVVACSDDGKGSTFGSVMASVHPNDLVSMIRALKKLIKELTTTIKEELDDE
jgi:hypothetical protein